MKLKIRFVKIFKIFYIQRKTWYGWRYIKYAHRDPNGSIGIKYYSPSKKKLLKKVLKEEFSTCKKHVTVYEYPTLKVY